MYKCIHPHSIDIWSKTIHLSRLASCNHCYYPCFPYDPLIDHKINYSNSRGSKLVVLLEFLRIGGAGTRAEAVQGIIGAGDCCPGSISTRHFIALSLFG
jgi:hypothetical protein